MTKTKKVVAMLLAFLMIFSSASVLASAWDVETDDGSTLEISTKFFKEVNGEWVETTKVAPGSNVKARVYLATDYYSNDSDLLFFYDKDFFTTSYGEGPQALTVNPDAVNKAEGYLMTNSDLTDYVDSAFLNEYAGIEVTLDVKTTNNVMFDDSTWLFEFDLTVLDSARGEGDLFVEETTIQNTDSSDAKISVPKGPADGTIADAYPMWLWDATPVLSSQPVSTDSSVTFSANEGAFADGATEKFGGENYIGATVTAPAAPTRAGYTFMGWIDAADATPTLEEAKATVLVTEVPENAMTYNAFWLKNVNITFNTDGGTEIPAINDVTPYTDFADVADPTKAGYTFVGWDVRDGKLPETYPDVDTEYTAIWALNVTVSFDTDGAEAIPSVDGYAGADFEAEIADPSKEGHRFVMWSPALPEVFPEQDTTYKAIFETKIYSVYYYVDGKMKSNIELEYGETIPTNVTSIKVPAGYELSGWYTDADYNNEYTGGTMGAEVLKLYAKTTPIVYNAVFVADGEVYEKIPTAYEAKLVAPATAPTKVGYEFAGWSPDAENGIFTETEDMYFYATWTPVNGNVIFVVDGTNYQVDDGIETGANIDVPAEPYKEGYEFLGWADTEGATEANVTFPQTMPALAEGEKIYYYAVFEIQSYNVIWDVDGKTTEETYEYNAAINVPADPEKTGYTFAGWEWTRTEGGAAVAEPTNMPAYNVTATATWNVNQYKVTWVVDGVKTEETYDYGETITVPADPEKEGYLFNGWDPTVVTTMGAADVTYTATWAHATDTPYTIETYIMDTEGNYGAAASTETKYGETDTTVSTAHVAMDGFTADTANSLLSGTVASDGSLVLKLAYSRNKYALTTDVDGEESPAGEYFYEAEIAEPAAPANKEGHTFAGWAEYTEGMKMPIGGQTLTATWTVNEYDVEFIVDGATVQSGKVAYGAAVNAPADPEKEGHTFAGWSPAVPATQGAADATYTATWTVNEYDVEFIVDGVTVQSGKVAYGAAVVAPADPEKDGYTFAGWSPAVPATQGAADATYTATWTVNKYTVTYANTGDTTIAAVEADFGTAIAPVEDPTWEGYTFRGWKWTDADGAEISAPATIPAYNVTATAQWTANSYTIDWMVDGQLVASDAHDFGEAITAPTEPTKDGYSFAGWTWTKKADGSAVAASTTMPAYDVVATAQWTAKGDTKYTVEIYKMATDGVSYEKVETIDTLTGATDSTATYVIGSETGFKVNAGKTTGYDAAANTANAVINGDGSTVIAVYYDRDSYKITINEETDDYLYGEEIEEPKKPTPPTGYEQDPENPWVDENGDPVEFPLTVDEDNPSEIKPNYKKLSYEIAWTIDGVTTTDTYEFKAAVTAPEIPAKEGYRVVGWVDADGKLATVPATMPASDLAYTALYETLVYGINYYVDGKLVATVSTEYGATIQAIDYNAPLGYEFDGWYTDEEMTVELGENAVVTAKSTDLYGKLVAKMYDAIFMVDGEVYDTVETAFDAQIAAPTDPVKEGYVFIGWTPDVTIMDEEGKTFVANFEPKAGAYTITYDVDGKTDVFELAVGDEFEIAAEPTKEGYEFAGWADAEGNIVDSFPATMPAENLVFTATWNVITYTVTWTVDGESTEEYYEFGATIVAPADPEKDGFEFAGWDPEVPATMPAENLEFTATWTELEDETPVKLVPVEGSTTMIERNKVIESYNDGYSVITDSYDYTTDSYEEYYIYGLKVNFRQRDIANYFTVQGDGRMEVDTTLSNGGYGTGCVIKVYDQKGTIDDTTDDVFVEQFYIIIFGDVDGNARISGYDVSMIKEDVVNKAWSGNRDGIPYMKKAASIDGNTRVSGYDATLLDEVVLRSRTLDQITGTTTEA